MSSTTGATRKTSVRSSHNKAIKKTSPAKVTDESLISPRTDDDGEPSYAPSSLLLPRSEEPVLLSPAQQQLYLHVLTLGASPSSACGKVGITPLDVLRTIDGDAKFREQIDQVTVLLSQNVAAALYRSAMEGSVSAQTFFLKNKPPPDWQAEDEPELTADRLKGLSDEELLNRCRASGIDVPIETSAGADSPIVEE